MNTLPLYTEAIIAGSVAWDVIMDFPSRFVDYLQPDKLHQINVSFVVDKLQKQLGGTGTNISYNCSLMTQKKVRLLSAIGKDGDQHIAFFKKNKIDIKGSIIEKKLYCATGTVITDIKDNQIWGFYYGAGARGGKINYKKLFGKNGLVILSANHKGAFLAAQNAAIKNKSLYIYDPGMSLSWISAADLKNGIEGCHYLIGNDYEIAGLEKTLKSSVAEWVKTGKKVITTLGEKGVRYQSRDENYYVPGYLIKKTIDPTGAGDAWRGGFMAGLLEKKSLVECLTQANALASFAVEHYGTVHHLPSLSQIALRAKKLKVTTL